MRCVGNIAKIRRIFHENHASHVKFPVGYPTKNFIVGYPTGKRKGELSLPWGKSLVGYPTKNYRVNMQPTRMENPRVFTLRAPTA